MFDFEEQLAVGKKGEQLVRYYYESQLDEGKTKFIVRDAKEEEQKKGADFFIINNELGCRYVEVKTDTRAEETGNVALEVQVVYGDTDKRIGCALKTFPDFLFYWIYPTNELLYWNPDELVPYIMDWLIEGTYKVVNAENKNFFSRSLIVPIEDLRATGVIHSISVSYHLLQKVETS